DAFAILLAAHHPNLKLLGISSVHGNASLSHTTSNVGSILTAIGSPDIPYYAGAAKPLIRDAVHAPEFHGTTGLDGTDLLPQALVPPVKDCDAIRAMHQALMAETAGTSWLVATGALTNIALLFTSYPEVAEHIRGLSIMGGAVGDGFTNAPLGKARGEESERCGNWTRWAEFNIYCDPEAAKSVFSNPVVAPKTTLIPLDVTHQVLATEEVRRNLLHGPSEMNIKEDPFKNLFDESSAGEGRDRLEWLGRQREKLVIRNLLNDLLGFFAQTYHDNLGITAGPPLHDPLAVAVVLFDIGADDLAFDDRGGERWIVDVVTEGLHSDAENEHGQLGRTMTSKSSGPGVCIPRALNVGSFWEIVEKCFQRAEVAILKRSVKSGLREDASPRANAN
ncbi:MAG: hypothetical protein Q9194_005495, partial [Teloschistes cf. exilis]